MSKSKHTPGPRRAIKGPDKACAAWDLPGCGFVLASDGNTVIGRFPKYEDAVLDAAAPDLLEALQSLCSMCYASSMADPETKRKTEWELAVDKARAAVAKATGHP